jgi:hypothetical protein
VGFEMNFWKNMDATARRIVGFGILVCVLIALFLTLGWCNSDRQAAKARGEGRVADAQAGLGSDAMKRADDVTQADAAGRVATQQNTDFITGADNANETAGEAGNRGRLAFCDRQRVRKQPEPDYCPALRGSYPAKP